MKTVTINIVKKSVMGVVEGLSATLAQHNPEVDFVSMWASDSEEKKLDIHYREAVTDLENEITKWLVSSTMQMDLQALADDYRMQLKVHTYWPSKLTGLLMNQIQNYLVHAVMAGWLNDFPEVKVSDYAGMGATDLEAIKEILLKKEFYFTEAARGEDNIGKEIVVSSAEAEARVSDGSDKDVNTSFASSRSSDGVGKNTSSANAEARSIDSSQKEEGNSDIFSRSSDNDNKEVSSSTAEARERDEQEKSVNNTETAGRSSDIDSKDSGIADISSRSGDEKTKELNELDASGRSLDGEGKEKSDKDVFSRSEDSDDKEAAYSEVSSRFQDHEGKEDHGTSAETRETDNDQKEGHYLSAEEREADNNQKEGQILHAGERETDGVDKLSKRGAEAAERGKDEATQYFCHDFVDWSGGHPPFILR